MSQFKVGDIVRLRSGGPKMTVCVMEGDRIGCEWFDEKGEHKIRTFDKAVLDKIEEQPIS